MNKLPDLHRVPDEAELLDGYQRLRRRVSRWASNGQLKVGSRATLRWGPLVEYLIVLPDLFHLVIRLLFDPRVPIRQKAPLIAAAAYLISPVDLIPDVIPVGGKLDDLIVVTKLLQYVLNENDPLIADAVQRHWAGEGDVLETLRQISDLADQTMNYLPNSLGKLIDRWTPRLTGAVSD